MTGWEAPALGAVLAVLLILLGWWARGHQPCDCDDRCPSNYAEPEDRYFDQLHDGRVELPLVRSNEPEPIRPSPQLMRSGRYGLVLHRPGCRHLVRPERVPDDGRADIMRRCESCLGGADV